MLPQFCHWYDLPVTTTEWCGWEGEVTWPRVLSLLSFPLTNPAAMLTLAAQVSAPGHICDSCLRLCFFLIDRQ